MTTASSGAAGHVAWADAARRERFERWLSGVAGADRLVLESLRPASSDASFRRYFRIDREPGVGDTVTSRIVMDAPPPQEDASAFVQVAARVEAAGLTGPRVLAQDADGGFLLLTDLGTTLLLDELKARVDSGDVDAAARRMRAAGSTLVAWQRGIDADGLPHFDEALLRRELALFPDWCVAIEYGVRWSDEQQAVWQGACDLLVQSALAQPTLAVHRDFMPRNLMSTPEGLGVLDFQDAVRGPVAYDVASMLRDAFLSWDEEVEIDLAVRYWEQARKAGLPVDADFGEFWRQIEWIGLQRHLKVLGIFCRLKHRDGKAAYSADLPRFFGYVHRVATRYRGFGPLALLVEPLMGVERVDAFH